ncbi:winged helix-turn-helix transcriptional regulator [Natronorubrum sulfidifaciens]|uniref:HoxA-like transcriptional regulator n=1 Tax=Natronorubrum sulfidifaciens JCM 14089 TaxID=1230460 RepID=L9VU01_9EURY|nr:winged helix-turn-helix transcriptional regulator [Natronorubrum sulfidifaciens]ELY40690.1 HoxA-like transcriptional regulator [Natronorubrum sulfidifaciens JCM 14089]
MDRRTVLVPPSDRLSLEVLELLSNKWEPAIILTLLHHEPLRFNELESALPDISANMLTTALASLAEHGLVQRQTISDTPPQVEYELTDSGRQLKPVFSTLSTWGQDHLETPTPTAVVADCDDRLTELYGEWLAATFDVTSVNTTAELRESLVNAPELVVVDIALWDGSMYEFETYCPTTTRRMLLVGDRPDLSLAAWHCDDVLRKPIRKTELVSRAKAQLECIGQSETERDCAGTEAKLSILESIYPQSQLKAEDLTAQFYDE